MSDHHVRIAQLAVARGTGRLVAVGLGSCVAISLYDRIRRIGGLSHVLLPDPSAARDVSNPARFASEAVPLLLDKMRDLGARGPFEAKLAGGAALFGRMLGSAAGFMGDRNVAAARIALEDVGISVLAEDVGGESGRSVAFDVSNGELMVRGVRGGQRVL